MDAVFYDASNYVHASKLPMKTEVGERIMEPFAKVFSRLTTNIPLFSPFFLCSPEATAEEARENDSFVRKSQDNWMTMTTQHLKMGKNEIPSVYERKPGRNVH